jgi:hypothetical protein
MLYRDCLVESGMLADALEKASLAPLDCHFSFLSDTFTMQRNESRDR